MDVIRVREFSLYLYFILDFLVLGPLSMELDKLDWKVDWFTMESVDLWNIKNIL